MNKKEVAVRISNESGIPVDACTKVVRRTFDIIREALAKGQRVRVDGFGVWVVRIRQAKMGRDLRQGGEMSKILPTIPIPRRGVVKFLPGKLMKSAASKLSSP